MTGTEVFASAKINLTLHVTGQRADGYHLLDSLVVFADIGDRLWLRMAQEPDLSVTGPMAAGVPTGPENLVLRAAALMGAQAEIQLEKHLPSAAGIGGGSSDAAAVLRALSGMTGRPVPDQGLALGADVPVCLLAQAAMMRGIGEQVEAVTDLPEIAAVLVNPGVEVPTGAVFKGLARKDNPPMTQLPVGVDLPGLVTWLAQQRNDLEAPARAVQPVIGTALDAIAAQAGCLLARMSGSGATCFGLFADAEQAQQAAAGLNRPGWWVRAVALR
ncbi:4-(cytidine 5'-diphospho)-2-C-methyl-D-erythritol kinase [Thalassovita taeanensis]|uniref:4-diphosphocytidyl-2-C-methyl-D-erythritol kinase n=1 Tax=Thalassovita taeanensis TaxID=657014 RepID=A0A1H9AQX0_9RHOB|nr:4-(cytidine 5'-diphospho)-2-C-methyl-D-erythritol kinase [Thalassovita taeanensis]SEP79166.1 4-diphosphocytidyl-2-C-methyl-D-erythritol kinase [Thalassovita taeanensis]